MQPSSFGALTASVGSCVCVCCAAVVPGAKKREEIYTAFENIYPTLKEYKKREAAEAAGLGPLAAKPSGTKECAWVKLVALRCTQSGLVRWGGGVGCMHVSACWHGCCP